MVAGSVSGLASVIRMIGDFHLGGVEWSHGVWIFFHVLEDNQVTSGVVK